MAKISFEIGGCVVHCAGSQRIVPSDEPFILLCSEPRKPLYAPLVQRYSGQIFLATDIVAALSRCIYQPPKALMIDLLSSSALGPEPINALLELEVSWPIARCTIDAAGAGTIMWLAGAKRNSFDEAFGEILAGDPTWQHPEHKRRFIRLEMPARVSIRYQNQTQWRRGNIGDLSVGGMFITSYEDWQKGDAVQVQLRDVTDEMISLGGKITWIRRWEDAIDLPGVGIAVGDGESSERLRNILSDPAVVAHLLKHFK